jgi:hypothetical protein
MRRRSQAEAEALGRRVVAPLLHAWHWFLTMAVTLGLVVLAAPAGAQATTVSEEGLTSTATATISPSHLPADRAVPVTLDLAMRTTRSTPGMPRHLRTQFLKVRTDRQITVDTEGLPTCPVGKIGGLKPSQARQRCGAALIGTGTLTIVHNFPEQGPSEERYVFLAFHTIVSGKPQILLYNYLQGTIGITDTVGDIGAFGFSVVDYDITSPLVLRLKFGAQWTYRGKRHSYLNATCATGSIRNEVTIVMSNGAVSGTTPQRC